jgi:DNA-binding transcriptional ArsR family regulator
MKTARVLKMMTALSQETRLAIFRLLIQTDEKGFSAGTIAEKLQIPAATLSFHLTQLAEAKLIESRREGRQIYYIARYKTVKKLYQFLAENSFHKRKEEKQKQSITPDDFEEGLDDDA